MSVYVIVDVKVTDTETFGELVGRATRLLA